MNGIYKSSHSAGDVIDQQPVGRK